VPETRLGHFLAHVLPAWISAICAILGLAITLYTLLLVSRTSNNVADIMNAMHAASPHR
jgi:hypothetical protein